MAKNPLRVSGLDDLDELVTRRESAPAPVTPAAPPVVNVAAPIVNMQAAAAPNVEVTVPVNGKDIAVAIADGMRKAMGDQPMEEWDCAVKRGHHGYIESLRFRRVK